MFKGQINNYQIRQKLSTHKWPKGYTLDSKQIDRIIDIFWFRDWGNSFIADPDIFQSLVEYLRDHKPAKFSRLSFYRYLFNSVKKDPLLRAAMEGLATAYEKLQINQLDKDLFESTLKELSLSIKIFEPVINKGWLKETTDDAKNKTYWEFSHHTVSEYFAAEHILAEKEKVIDKAKGLMIFNQDNFIAFKNSWYGVLRFLNESDHKEKFISWILELAEKPGVDIVDDDFADYMTQVDPDDIDSDLSHRIYQVIYNTFQTKLLWIPAYCWHRLGLFAPKGQYEQLKKDVVVKREEYKNETQRIVRQGNMVAVAGGMLLNKNKWAWKNDNEFWKNKLIEFATDDNENGVLQRHSLHALEAFKGGEALITKVEKAFGHKERLVKEAFLSFCYRIAPNSKIAIDQFVKAIKEGLSIYGRHGLYEVTEKTAVKYLLNKFVDDEVLLDAFVDKESIFSADRKDSEGGDRQLLNNIKKVLDSEIVEVLKQIINKTLESKKIIGYHIERSAFLKRIAQIIQSSDEDYYIELIDGLKEINDDDKQWSRLYDLQGIFAWVIGERNLVSFYRLISQIERGDYIAASAIVQAERERGGEGK